MLYSPEFGADLNINHVINIGSYDLSLTAVGSYRDEQQTNFVFLDETVADSYTTLNLDATLLADNAGWSDNGGWSISAYVRNVTDEQFYTNSNVQNRGLTYAISSPPRTYGLRLMASF